MQLESQTEIGLGQDGCSGMNKDVSLELVVRGCHGPLIRESKRHSLPRKLYHKGLHNTIFESDSQVLIPAITENLPNLSYFDLV